MLLSFLGPQSWMKEEQHSPSDHPWVNLPLIGLSIYTQKSPLDIHACPPPACIEMNSICYDVLKVNCKDQ